MQDAHTRKKKCNIDYQKELTQQFQLAILLQSCNTQATKNNIDNNITKKNSKPQYKAISLHRPCNGKPSNVYLNKDKKKINLKKKKTEEKVTCES